MIVKTFTDVCKFVGQKVVLRATNDRGSRFSYVGVMDAQMKLFESGPGIDIDVSGDSDTISYYTMTKWLLENYDVTLELA